jgi:hypothetical protein
LAETGLHDLHVDSWLTGLSIGYKNPVYIADTVFPTIPVQRQSNLIPRYDQSPWFRNQAHNRAPGTIPHRDGFTVSSALYSCLQYAFGYEIPDEYRDNTDAPYDLDRDGTAFVTDRLQMAREINAATEYFKAGVWGSEHTPGVGPGQFVIWDDYQNSQPLIDISNWQEEVVGRGVPTPNTLVIGSEVWASLKWHPNLTGIMPTDEVRIFTQELLRTSLELDRVLVGKALFTPSLAGTPEASVVYQRIWGKNALVAYIAPNPALMTPSAGYTFVWNRVPNALQYISRIREDNRYLDVINGFSHWDTRVLVPGAGEIGLGVVS